MTKGTAARVRPGTKATATKAAATNAAVAGEVWQTIVGFFLAHREHHLRAVHELGLTPGDMKALLVLDVDCPRSMGELAEMWACDASNSTWIVDRLEERGLVERRAHPRDRRVKTVFLTAEGARMKGALVEKLGAPPVDLLALERADLDTLRGALALLPPHPTLGEQRRVPVAEAG